MASYVRHSGSDGRTMCSQRISELWASISTRESEESWYGSYTAYMDSSRESSARSTAMINCV
ncbi:hypothetical protein BRADI_2g44852v3 [Brachypodium distachyon]|uniref:Uncharacterized protein n=1 Tax=Brachypodium distachyon TaxID=15368 RepID=A0A2K2DDV0_BRADI|nr:hypothetical protein BRADI_2g44852v3 [Brachypodium distachyon]